MVSWKKIVLYQDRPKKAQFDACTMLARRPDIPIYANILKYLGCIFLK